MTEMPDFIAPMLARLSALPAEETEASAGTDDRWAADEDNRWAYEVKWDGVRAIARSEPRSGSWSESRSGSRQRPNSSPRAALHSRTRSRDGRLRLFSRNGNDVTAAYPELRGLADALGTHAAMLDGEIIAFDASGRPSFEALQPRMHQRSPATVQRLAKMTPVTYVVFDLLWLDGRDLMELPYAERRARLDELDLNGEHWRTPPYHAGPGEGRSLLDATREQGLEGVVAKRLDSPYVPGSRGGSWLKIKHHNHQEVVIGGWHEGQHARAGQIGALDVGVYEENASEHEQRDESTREHEAHEVDEVDESMGAREVDESTRKHEVHEVDESMQRTGLRDSRGGLRYAGQVGTGWDERELAWLHRLLEGLARPDSPFTGRQPPRGTHFVEPHLVCEVEFSDWTRAGQLRQASYKGLREDKPAQEVVRERARAPAEIDEANKHSVPERLGKSREMKPKSKPTAKTKSRKTQTKTSTTAISIPFEAARSVRGGVEVELDGRTLRLTNLDKVFYPQTGFTKGDMVGYYAAIAPVLLGHLRDRPLTLKRYPDGVQGESFYEKQCPSHRPAWIHTVAVDSERSGRAIDYCACQDLPTLVWLANLAALELHPSLSLGRALARPTVVAFDLDPGTPAGLAECCAVALHLRDMFAELGLTAVAKTSGVKGMQVYLPLNDDDVNEDDGVNAPARVRARTRARSTHDQTKYEQTKPFARAVAELLAHRHPRLVTATMTKSRRHGRVLIDWSQNDEHKTTVSVYSLRATPVPSVSAPLDWEEVRACRDSGDAAPLQLGPAEVLERVGEQGDLFAPVLTLRQKLPKLR